MSAYLLIACNSAMPLDPGKRHKYAPFLPSWGQSLDMNKTSPRYWQIDVLVLFLCRQLWCSGIIPLYLQGFCLHCLIKVMTLPCPAPACLHHVQTWRAVFSKILSGLSDGSYSSLGFFPVGIEGTSTRPSSDVRYVWQSSGMLILALPRIPCRINFEDEHQVRSQAMKKDYEVHWKFQGMKGKWFHSWKECDTSGQTESRLQHAIVCRL